MNRGVPAKPSDLEAIQPPLKYENRRQENPAEDVANHVTHAVPVLPSPNDPGLHSHAVL